MRFLFLFLFLWKTVHPLTEDDLLERHMKGILHTLSQRSPEKTCDVSFQLDFSNEKTTITRN